MNVKKLFLFAIVLTILLCCISSFAQANEDLYEKSFDAGFKVYLPDNFMLVDVNAENQSSYFDAQKTYEYTGEHERLRVMIGADSFVDELFTVYFSNADEQNLDLSVFTNKQLIEQSEHLNSFVGDHFPVYLTYKVTSSQTFDNKLSLVSTAYYVDKQKNVTGMVKAYQFYYLDSSIIFFYDTLIDGVYYDAQSFDTFDSIISSIEFEKTPTVNLKNPALTAQVVQTAIRPFFVLFFGALFGYLFAKLSILYKSVKPSQRIKKDKSIDSVISQLYEEINVEVDPLKEDYTDKQKQHEAYEEAIDWNSLIKEVKSEKESKHSKRKKRSGKADADYSSKEDITELTSIDDELLSTRNVNDDVHDSSYTEDLIYDETHKVAEDVVRATKDEKELSEDYTTEISESIMSDALKNTTELEDETDIAKLDKKARNINTPRVKNLLNYVDNLIAQKNKTSESNTEPLLKRQNNISDEKIKDENTRIIASSDVDMIEQKSDSNISLEPISEILSEKNSPFDTSELNELIEEYGDDNPLDSHEEYLNKILPKRRHDFALNGKTSKAPKIVLADKSKLKLDTPSELDLENIQKEIFSFLKKEQKTEAIQPEQSNKPPKDNPIKMGRISKFLNSIVSKIEQDDDVTSDEYEGVESRKELHRSEKVERNKIEDLIPGILEDDDDTEVLDVVIDESLDVSHMKKNNDK